jgi:hypothetical protein
VCPDCGTREEEWDADDEAYVTLAVRCPGCEAIADRQAEIPQDARGIKVSLVTPAVKAAVRVKAEMRAREETAERIRLKAEQAQQ